VSSANRGGLYFHGPRVLGPTSDSAHDRGTPLRFGFTTVLTEPGRTPHFTIGFLGASALGWVMSLLEQHTQPAV